MSLNEYDALLEGDLPQGNEYDRLIGELQQGTEATLKQSVKQAQKTAPDAKAKARQIADRLKMPVEMVERNPELFKAQDSVENLPYEDLIRANPKLGQWLADPVNAGVASDDIQGLQRVDQAVSFLDSVKRGTDIAQSLVYRSVQATGEAVGSQGLTEFGRAGALRNLDEAGRYGARSSLFDVRNAGEFGQWMKEFAGEQIPMIAPSLGGSAAGAGIGTLIAPGIGTGIGAAIGAFIPAFALNVGSVESAVKEKGGEDATATAAVFIGGSAVAALDTILPAKVGSQLTRVFGFQLAEQIAVKALAKPVAQQYVRRVAGSVAGGMATEGLTEAIQEAVEEVAAAAGMGTPVDWASLAAQAAEAGVGGAILGGAISGATEAVTPNHRVTAAQQGAQVITGLGAAIEASKTAQRLPQAVESFIAQATKDGPVETVYAPVDSWVTYWQGKGLDPATVAADVTGNAQAFEHAIATGADLAIPLAKYAARLAGTEHNAFFANEIRLSPEQMNAREADEFLEQQAQQNQGESAPDGGDSLEQGARVGESARTQLEGAGVEPGVASSYAALDESAFTNLAERAGLTPEALYGRYGLTITREGMQNVGRGNRPVAGPVISGAPGQQPAPDAGGPVQTSGDGGSTERRRLPSALDLPALDAQQYPTGFVRADESTDRARLTPDVARELARIADELRELPFEPNTWDFDVPDRSGNAAGGLANIVGGAAGAEVYGDILSFAPLNKSTDKVRKAEKALAEARDADRPASEIAALEQAVADAKAGPQVAKTTERTRSQVLAAIERAIQTGTIPSNIAEGAVRVAERRSAGDYRDISRPMLPHKDAVEVPEGVVDALSDAIDEAVDAGVLEDDSFDPSTFEQGEKPEGGLFDTLDTGEQQPRLPGAEDVRETEVPTPTFELPFSLTPPKGKGTRGKQTTLFQSVPVPFPTIDTESASALFRAADASQAQVIAVPISSLVATQATVDDEIVASKQAGDAPPVALAHEGKYYLADGTHRAAAALARGEETFKVTAWPVDPALLSAPPAYRSALDEMTLRQVTRGKITFGKASVTIELLKNADLSTFLHETGHFYLEVLRDLASQSEQIAADVETLNATLFEGAETETEKHERFARAFEAYLMEGNAPSPELRSVFARFSAWLKNIYKSLTALNVQLTPEVRGVFDRLLASDEAIATAEAEGRIAPLFTDAASAGVSEDVFASYQNDVRTASESARDELRSRFMREVTREQTKQWHAQRRKIRQEVLAEIYTAPVYRARAAILRGTNPDGTPLVPGQTPEPMKGVPLDTVAELFGFSSGDELSQALKAAPPMPRAIKAETDRRMKALHGDLLTDPATVADHATAAVFGEGRAKVISAELKALTTGMARGTVPPARVVNQIAETRVRAMKVRDLKPGLFLMAAQRASQRAFEAFAKNDRQAVIAAKQQELLSLAMYRTARDAQEAADKVVPWVRKNDTTAARAILGKAGESYQDTWDGLLHQYEFKNVPNKVLDRRASLQDWMESQQALGLPMDLPPAVVAQTRQVNYRDLTVEQLGAVMDTLKSIRYFARSTDALLTKEGRRQMAEIEGAIIPRLYESAKPGRTIRLTRSQGMLDRAKEWGRGVASSLLNPDTILRELDGWKNLGPVYTHIKGQIDRAIVEDLLPRSKAAGERLHTLMSVYEHGALKTKEFIPALRDSLTKEEILSIALNWGTADNRAALLESKKFAALGANARTVDAILDRLDQRDWDYVQSVWDYLDTFWEDIRASGLRRTGIAPKKVEAVPVQTKFGTYRGGYYTLKYDSKGSILATQDEIHDIVQRMQMGRFASAQTKAGFRIERVGSGGRPVLLSLNVIQQHVQSVIYDLALGDAVRYSDRVLRSKAIREAFEATGADDAYHALQLWLHDVASGEQIATDRVSRTARHLRSGITISSLLFNMGSVAVQPSGIAQTFAVLHKRDALSGVVDLLTRKWVGAGNVFEQVIAASPFMATRQTTYNKDIMTSMERIEGNTKTAALMKAGYYAMTKAQWVVDVATWLGAQRQGLREFEGDTKKATAFADRMVARAQASGLFADRSGFERGTLSAGTRQSEFVRMWTTLGSYMFAKGNVLYEKTRGTDFKNPASVAAYAADLTLLFAVEALLIGLLRGSFDDEDSLAWGLLKETAQSVLATIPFVREAGSEIEGFRGGGPIGAVAQKIGNLTTQIEQGELDAALIRAANSVGGVFLKYPSSAVNKFINTEDEDVPLIEHFIYREHAQ